MNRIDGIARNGVDRAKLKTDTASAAGTLAAATAITIVQNAYSFVPDISIETTLAALEPAGSGPTQVDSPRVRLRNNDSVTRAYQASWRYITA